MDFFVFLQISQISSSVMGLFGGAPCDLVWWGWVWNFSLAWVAWVHIVQLGPAALVAGLARLLHIVQLGPSALEAGLAHHRVQLGQMGGLWVYMLIFGLKLGIKLDWVCTWQQATL